ncbi:MAG TPA: hypothetical protein PKH77_00925 [Anaerolineae bacterium]|nr:hypothetical protein [Anaerolineae bacterium]
MDNPLQSQYFLDAFDDVLASDQPDIDKLAWAFGRVTEDIIATARQEIEVATALHDTEAKIKVQIKMETIKHARHIFATHYQRITGRSVWNE